MEALAERNANIADEAPLSTGKPAKIPRLENKEAVLDSAPVSGPNSTNVDEMLSADKAKEAPPAEAVEEASAAGVENASANEPAPREEAKPDVVATAKPSSSASVAEDMLLVKKLSDKATLPKRASASAAGYDLASAEDKLVPKHGKALIKTDLAIRVPSGTYGRVAPRSGLASKNFIDTGAGVIDEDYRGNVGVLLFNHSDEDFQVKVGDRVAQLVLEKIAVPDVMEVEELDSTERGAQGYGSTGVAAQ